MQKRATRLTFNRGIDKKQAGFNRNLGAAGRAGP